MVPPESDGFGPDRYGESFADVYDEWYDDVSDAEATEAFTSSFGKSQTIVELGVGTGRLSSPLVAAGHRVVGIDASMSMLTRFRSPDPAWPVGADMVALPVATGSCDTVLVATNTLFNLHEPGAQARCIEESRRVLRLGGRVIIEAMVPGDPDPALDRLVTTKAIEVDAAVLTATIRDRDAQQITGQHIEIRESGIRLRPWKIRYSTIDELDAMAEAAGFRLGERWSDWARTPFTDDAANAVSVYVAV